MSWIQPRQNSLEALTLGINYFDGVEFDLRLSSDDVLMLRHDNTTPEGKFVENLSSDELATCADRFDDLLSKPDFVNPWQESGKTVCIELKSPHPSSGVGGGWTDGKERVKYLAKMIRQVDESISEFELPDGTTVLYAFDKKFLSAVKQDGCKHPCARLMPNLREWGKGKFKKVVATPSFIANSLPRSMRFHQNRGAPMIPCALEYLTGYTRHLTLGRTVGLKGKALTKLTNTRRGFPAFVWPVKLSQERLVLDAGLTALTDDASTEITHLPDGSPRNTRPASEPIVAGQQIPWREMTIENRKDFLSMQRKQWKWRRSIDELMASSNDNQIPWEVPRIIGHRGTGKTSQLDFD
ncbi:MAG: hypothetical protein HOE69_06100 [Euryarchaeota archaeon]|nr:hypothetical protein [Euryarchaeota archaeon]